MNDKSKKKSFIEWKVNLKHGQSVYSSDEVKIDDINWVFSVKMNEASSTFDVYVHTS